MTSFRKALRGVLLASALFAVPATAAEPYSETIFFGDSLTDAGFYRPLLPANVQPVTGQFTTNPGFVWAQFLADYYGTDAVANGNGQTGTDYAAGGARVGVDVPNPTFGITIPSLATQVDNYLDSTGGQADPDALYTVWGGANDLFAITNAGADPTTTIGGAVAAQVGIVQTLTAAGAEYILVPTVPDLGVTPAFRVQGAGVQATGTALTTSYNNALFSSLSAAGLRVIPLNTFALIREVVADPAEYGFSNVTGTACQPQITANSLLCNPSSYVSSGAPEAYVFADGVHPTTGAHRVLAQYAYSVLEAPRYVQQLPFNATVNGRSRAERVAQHVGKVQAEGLSWWANGRFDLQNDRRIDNRGPALLLGLDWHSGGLVAGAFAGYGRTDFKLGSRAGDASQSDLTGGLFAGYYGSAFWANGQLSYTRLNFDVDREVQLGQASRTHSGSPDGRNLTAAVQAGADFAMGSLKVGPVVGLTAQRVRVDGYAESEGDLSTALAYGKQKVNSLIGSAGLQASYQLEEGTAPYLRATYDHDFKAKRRDAFATLQTIDTLPFAVPGIEWDRSYGTVTGGIRTSFAGIDANVGASTTVGREDGENVAAFLTVGQRF